MPFLLEASVSFCFNCIYMPWFFCDYSSSFWIKWSTLVFWVAFTKSPTGWGSVQLPGECFIKLFKGGHISCPSLLIWGIFHQAQRLCRGDELGRERIWTGLSFTTWVTSQWQLEGTCAEGEEAGRWNKASALLHLLLIQRSERFPPIQWAANDTWNRWCLSASPGDW